MKPIKCKLIYHCRHTQIDGGEYLSIRAAKRAAKYFEGPISIIRVSDCGQKIANKGKKLH